MAKVQKVYTREFKEEAVRLAQTSGKPITQVARELGISRATLIKKIREYELGERPGVAGGARREGRTTRTENGA